jgi:hypothetical protein
MRLTRELVRLVGKARAGEEVWCFLHRPGPSNQTPRTRPGRARARQRP